MPHLSGIFEQFVDLDKVPVNKLSGWLRIKPESHALANFFGNRLLYPQSIALNSVELEMDLAILREGLIQKPSIVLDNQTGKIFVPTDFIQRFPPFSKLIGAIVEALSPKGIIQIYTKQKSQVKLVGSVISPIEIEKIASNKKQLKIIVDGVASMLNVNTISISPISSPEILVKIENHDFKAIGGELGIIIDLRLKAKNG